MLLYSWGANSHGQLGLSVKSEQETKPRQLNLNDFDFKSIKGIYGGGGHVIILSNSGNCLACGWNNKGQLGIGSTEDRYVFKSVNTKIKFKSVACGWECSAGITEDGVLYIWGACFKSKEFLPKRLSVPYNEKVKQVQFGLNFCCLLTENNSIYLFGKSKCINVIKSMDQSSVIHVDNVEFVKYPTTNVSSIKSISCGQNHFIVLSSKGITPYGDNRFGQCGIGSGKLIEIVEEVTDIKCGWTHNGYLTKRGELYLWGRNSYGQLGRSDVLSVIENPTKLNVAEEIRSFCLGSEHGMAVTISGAIYTWGWNEHGNCGNGTIENVFEPQKLNMNRKTLLIGSGAGFCYVLCDQTINTIKKLSSLTDTITANDLSSTNQLKLDSQYNLQRKLMQLESKFINNDKKSETPNQKSERETYKCLIYNAVYNEQLKNIIPKCCETEFYKAAEEYALFEKLYDPRDKINLQDVLPLTIEQTKQRQIPKLGFQSPIVMRPLNYPVFSHLLASNLPPPIYQLRSQYRQPLPPQPPRGLQYQQMMGFYTAYGTNNKNLQ